jgi:DNA-binding protein HU-beta
VGHGLDSPDPGYWSGPHRTPVEEELTVNAVSRAARAVTHPVHTAGSLAGRTVGMTLGAAKVGVRTTARVVGWAVERAGGPTPQHPSETYSAVTVPPVPVTPPEPAPAPARKVPANEVPLKSAPTPSLPAGVEDLDAAVDDVPQPTRAPARKSAAKKSPAKKTAARKTSARKAPSKQAAVLAPALGLSEAEVAEVSGVAGDDADNG